MVVIQEKSHCLFPCTVADHDLDTFSFADLIKIGQPCQMGVGKKTVFGPGLRKTTKFLMNKSP